jgi:hypothetical protein
MKYLGLVQLGPRPRLYLAGSRLEPSGLGYPDTEVGSETGQPFIRLLFVGQHDDKLNNRRHSKDCLRRSRMAGSTSRTAA